MKHFQDIQSPVMVILVHLTYKTWYQSCKMRCIEFAFKYLPLLRLPKLLLLAHYDSRKSFCLLMSKALLVWGPLLPMCHTSESRDGVHTVNYLMVTVICQTSIWEREKEKGRKWGRRMEKTYTCESVTGSILLRTYPCDIMSPLSDFLRKQKSLAPVSSINSWYLNLR